VNTPIYRVFVIMLLLFGLLVYSTSKWAVFDSDSLQEKPQDRRPLIEEQQIHRGNITTADGKLIAQSLPVGGGPHPVYIRQYSGGTLYGNPVGYNFVDSGRTGIEQSENDLLVGNQNEFASILDQLENKTQEGANVTLTIDSRAQEVAAQGLQNAIASVPGAAGNGGSAVAIDPNTGAVKAMVSIPGFDPNKAENDISELNKAEGAPILNRATQSVYPPGSTMKVVTAAAALDSGTLTPQDTLSGRTGIQISGVPLENAGGESFGDIDMKTALTFSVNTWFAQAGEKVGTDTMVEYMKRFGFYSDPELDYPDNQMKASGPINSDGQLVTDGFDVGRVAIGQGGEEGQALVTPTQMAEVAAAIANGGVLEKPTFLQEAKDPDGRTIESLDSAEQDQVMSGSTASELTDMMLNVTNDPEATGAGLTVNGQTFPGKTGTAEINIAQGLNQPWFIGFAPAKDPQVAVAVTVERCTGCFGAQVAGPIATQLMETVINSG
jgi:peptidoglycan glycosyltransferase